MDINVMDIYETSVVIYICIFFYCHHTDRNHSIKSHIVTLTNLEKPMLIYVLDLFDGEGPEAPKDQIFKFIWSFYECIVKIPINQVLYKHV
jgi:hypothetical protein